MLLDVDGTLIDSNDAHTSAWLEALREHGCTVPFERVRRMIGMGGDKLLPAARESTWKASSARRSTRAASAFFWDANLPTLRPFPCTRALLERLRGDNFRLVVASSAQSEELEPLLEQAGVADLLAARADADDADRSKPDPDIVHAALVRTGLAPHQAVLIGDTPYDIAAAMKACVATIAVRCGGWRADALQGAIRVYDDPADLLAQYDFSPMVPQAEPD